jgi:hypothetical protein
LRDLRFVRAFAEEASSELAEPLKRESQLVHASRSDCLCGCRTKKLNLFAGIREINFQFEAIRTVEIPIGAIERDKCRRLDRQTLFQIGRLQRRALDSDAAVVGSNRQPDRCSGPERQSERILV